jgi:hypothetical protein
VAQCQSTLSLTTQKSIKLSYCVRAVGRNLDEGGMGRITRPHRLATSGGHHSTTGAAERPQIVLVLYGLLPIRAVSIAWVPSAGALSYHQISKRADCLLLSTRILTVYGVCSGGDNERGDVSTKAYAECASGQQTQPPSVELVEYARSPDCRYCFNRCKVVGTDHVRVGAVCSCL